MELLDPAFLGREDVRAALAARDVGAFYRLLWQAGVSQRQIARRTNQSQSEVSEIFHGRQVRDVWVLERIADGFGIARAWMGLGYGEQQLASSSVERDVDEEMKRRALIAATSMAALGQVIEGLGEPIELALPSARLPTRLDMSHVHAVRAVTHRLRGMARYYGGQADLFGAVVQLYTPWLQVPASEAVQARLAGALAELYTEAGWTCYDSGVDGCGYFTGALRLTGQVGDTYGIANAAWHAGATLVRTGHPNDALKLFQLGQFRLGGSAPGKSTPKTLRADDPRLPTLTARLNLNSATAYALLGSPDQAKRCLTQAHDGWASRDAFERAGMDRATAGIHLDLGQLDAAEQFAASAARTYGEGHRRGRTLAELLLAEVYVRADEPRGLTLAHQAIDQVSTLESVAARRERLLPLAAALEARPGSDTRELARTARKVAATRSSG